MPQSCDTPMRLTTAYPGYLRKFQCNRSKCRCSLAVLSISSFGLSSSVLSIHLHDGSVAIRCHSPGSRVMREPCNSSGGDSDTCVHYLEFCLMDKAADLIFPTKPSSVHSPYCTPHSSTKLVITTTIHLPSRPSVHPVNNVSPHPPNYQCRAPPFLIIHIQLIYSIHASIHPSIHPSIRTPVLSCL